MTTESPRSWPRVALALALTALTIGLYLRGAGHEFVSLDDYTYVARNAQVRAGLSGESIGWAFTTTHAANWHPVTWLSHMLDVELFGLDGGGHHVTNAVLHGLGTLALLLALVGLTRAYWPSFFVAALFALHPLRVESVAWVSERKDLLAGLFAFAALGAYARYARAPSRGRYALVALALALSLMSKPMAVTLPFVLLLLDVWPLGRTTGEDGRPFAKLVVEKLPLFLIVAVSCFATFVAQQSGGAVRTVDQLGLTHRIANAFEGYGWYAWKLVWPTKLACFYPHAGYLDPDSYSLVSAGPLLGLAFLVAGTVLALAFRKRVPALLIGWLWFVGTLVPMIGLVQVGQQATADRYTYLSLIGLSIALVWAFVPLASCCRAGRIVVPALGVVAIGCLVPVTRNQIDTWKNNTALYDHALAVTDRNYTAFNNLGVVLESQNDLIAAEYHYRQALELQPEFSAALINLGSVRQKQGDLDEAQALYEQALVINPRAAEAFNNLGVLSMEREDYGGALPYFERALGIDPDHLEANRNLAQLHSTSANWQAALVYAERAASLAPEDARAAYGLGAALFNVGMKTEAQPWLERALELDPGSTETAQALAALASEEGRTGDALKVLEDAVAATPTWANGCFELARIHINHNGWQPAIEWLQKGLALDDTQPFWADQLARILQACPILSLRDLPEAIRWGKRAVELTSERNPQYLSTVATAYANSGDFDQAIAWQTKAIDAAPILEKGRMRAVFDTIRAEQAKARSDD